MRRGIQILVLLVLFSGCSFKKSGNQSVAFGLQGTHLARFDWDSKSKPENNQYIKASRELVAKAGNSFSAEKPVTLPVPIPNPLTISNEGMGSLEPSFRFAKAFADFKGNSVELPIAVSFSDGELRFIIEGLPSVFSSELHQENVLRVSLFGDTGKIADFSYFIRTPPSAVSIQSLSVEEAGQKPEIPLESGFKAPTINGQSYALVAVVSVVNDESQPVEVELPTSLSGRLFQDVTTRTYQDFGCEGGDYSYSIRTWTDEVSNRLYLVPIDTSVIMQLQGAVLDAKGAVLSIRVPAKGTSYLAVFAKTDRAQDWASGKGFLSTAQNLSLNGGCYVSYGPCQDRGLGERGQGCGGRETIRHRKPITLRVGEDRSRPVMSAGPFTYAVKFIDIDQLPNEGERVLQLNLGREL